MAKLRISLLLAGAVAAPVLAQAGGPPSGGDRPPPPSLSRADVQAMARAHFERVDTNHDGFISRDEAEAVRGPMGGPMGGPPGGPPGGASVDGASPPPEGGRMHMRMGGGMGGGMGSGVGLFTMLNGHAFDRADADHDGRVSLGEAEAEAMRLFDRVDVDHDGTISPEERRIAREALRLRRAGQE